MERWLELYNVFMSYIGEIIDLVFYYFNRFDLIWIIFPFFVSISLSIITLVLHYFAKGLSDVS